MKKRYIIVFLILFIAAGLTLCGFKEMRAAKVYKNGVYEGEHKDEQRGNVIKAILEIKDNRIVSCQIIATDSEGRVKDVDYGKGLGEENYKKAQAALEGMKQYPDILVKTQDVDKIDAVSGATASLKEFQTAVHNALNKAE